MLSVLTIFIYIFIQSSSLPTGLKTCPDHSEMRLAMIHTPDGSHQQTPGDRFCDTSQMTDRYGVPIAYIVNGDGWHQAQLVQTGKALVLSQAGEKAGLDILLGLEQEARAEKRGIWGDTEPPYGPVREALLHKGKVAVLFGTVVGTGESKDRYFLNFGEDWKTDFTIEIPRKRARSIKFNPEELDGQMVEVRGAIDEKDGPRMIITRPGQIRLLSPMSIPQ